MTNDALNKEEFFDIQKRFYIVFYRNVGTFLLLWNESFDFFYLTKYHLFSDTGNLLIGSYAALVYAVLVIEVFIDRYLGFRKAIVLRYNACIRSFRNGL
jgi:POT family proton-dependent oligopeptide transporter